MRRSAGRSVGVWAAAVLSGLLAAGCTAPGARLDGGGGTADMSATQFDDVDMADNGDLAFACGSLECMQVNCGETSPSTTLKGTVFAPNGTLPLYNVIVYVPNAPVDAFTSGLSCDRCDGHVTGKPLVITQTKFDGSFELPNMPAGDNIPLVMQIGKWRRQVTINHVAPCAINDITNAHKDKTHAETLLRLPRKHSEGDMPKMAIATGSADPMECLLLKLGLDSTPMTGEFRDPGKGGHVDVFKAAGSPGTTLGGTTPDASDKAKGLYASFNQLKNYDIVLLPCEGSPYDHSVGTKNLVDYVNAGGRVFATHYSYTWLTYMGSPFNRISNPLVNGLWHADQIEGVNTVVATLIQDFPKGKAFAKWLVAAQANSPLGTLSINDIRHDIDTVDKKWSQPWATDTFMDGKGTPLLTFNTPLDAGVDDAGVKEYCGRVVYSDFHVAASESNGGIFPAACINGAKGQLSDQEKALAFMIFDLSSCVQPDDEIPVT